YRWALPRRQRTGCVDGRAGSFYVMDRGYLDFSRLHTLHQAGAYFVIRARRDLRFVRYVSQPIDPDTGLCSDHIGRLQGFYSRKDFPDKLRQVRFYDTVQDRRFSFLTNQLLLPALTICQLYKTNDLVCGLKFSRKSRRWASATTAPSATNSRASLPL